MIIFVIIGKGSLLRMDKRGSLTNEVIVQIILVVLVFSFLLMVTADKINARGVRQQVVEKELALLVDSSIPGMSFSVWKVKMNGLINDIKIKNGKIFVSLDGLASLKGYGYFSKYDVSVEDVGDKFMVIVK